MVSFDTSFRVTFLLREVITVVQAEERILANWRSPENVEMEQLARKREREKRKLADSWLPSQRCYMNKSGQTMQSLYEGATVWMTWV